MHTRVHRSLLADVEKRALIWIAARLPDRIHSDHLTALALLAMVLAGASFWLARVSPAGLWLVVICLAVNWFGDSLDGTLARVRRQERPRYGFYVDHVIDIAGITALFGGLALSSYMTPIVAACLLVAYLLVAAEVFLATATSGTFTMSFLGIGPTELRIILAAGALTLLVQPTSVVFGRTYLLFDVGGVVAAVGLLVTFVVAAVRNTRLLARAEPRAERGAR